jgi:hypothetical protein
MLLPIALPSHPRKVLLTLAISHGEHGYLLPLYPCVIHATLQCFGYCVVDPGFAALLTDSGRYVPDHNDPESQLRGERGGSTLLAPTAEGA